LPHYRTAWWLHLPQFEQLPFLSDSVGIDFGGVDQADFPARNKWLTLKRLRSRSQHRNPKNVLDWWNTCRSHRESALPKGDTQWVFVLNLEIQVRRLRASRPPTRASNRHAMTIPAATEAIPSPIFNHPVPDAVLSAISDSLSTHRHCEMCRSPEPGNTDDQPEVISGGTWCNGSTAVTVVPTPSALSRETLPPCI
jgi:hypothetical protein